MCIRDRDKFFNWLKDSIGVKIKRSWVIKYNKGQSANSHRHIEYKTTFSYGINIPEGSSPLIISGDKIEPVVGGVVAFSGKLYHSVPPSEVDGRCILVGHG